MPNSHPFLSRTAQQFAREVYGDRPPGSVLALAPSLTVLYHALVTSADWDRPGHRGFNAYMFLALFREMSQEE